MRFLKHVARYQRIKGYTNMLHRHYTYLIVASCSIPGSTRFSEWVWNGLHSASRVQLRSYVEEIVAASV
jgi:hypothetical protein